MRYSANAKQFKGHGLTPDCFSYYLVDISSIPTSFLEEAHMDRVDDSNTAWLSRDEIETLINADSSVYDRVDWSSGEVDEEYRKDFLSELIKPARRYLIYARGVRWNGSDGYKIVTYLPDAFCRNYDCTICVDAATKGGKVLRCVESSHDVPMGNYTYVIALTDTEYGAIEYGNQNAFLFAENIVCKLA